jgi:hypothetical protein
MYVEKLPERFRRSTSKLGERYPNRALVKVFAVILNAGFLDQRIGHEYKLPGSSGGEFQLREIWS